MQQFPPFEQTGIKKMAGYTFCRWFAAVCLFSIMGLMTSFYIVEKSCTPLYHLARFETPRIPVSGKISSRRPIATAKSAVMTTLPTGVGANQTREVTLQCKTVCSKSGNDICIPLDLAVFVYKDGIPTENMTFTLQSHYPVVSIPRNTNISNDSSALKVDRCNLEEHFPGVELIPRQGSCAVVGNSGILNNSSCGDFIDSHDFVIRANMGLIKGYEVDVGRTSDLNAFNRATLLKYGHAIRAAKKSVERDRFLEHVRTLKESILWYAKSLTKPGGIHRSSVIYRSVINETRENGLSGIRFAFNWKPIRVEKAWGLRRIATLGLDMYAVARTFCANITLFGFYPFYKDLEGRDIKYHYFDDVKFNYSLNKAHSWDLEHRKLKELERQGKLTLIVRDCKPRKQIPV